MVPTWFWIGTIGMALGMALFAATGTNTSEDVKHHDVIHFVVVTIAAIAYLSMAMGESKVLPNESPSPERIEPDLRSRPFAIPLAAG